MTGVMESYDSVTTLCVADWLPAIKKRKIKLKKSKIARWSKTKCITSQKLRLAKND